MRGDPPWACSAIKECEETAGISTDSAATYQCHHVQSVPALHGGDGDIQDESERRQVRVPLMRSYLSEAPSLLLSLNRGVTGLNLQPSRSLMSLVFRHTSPLGPTILNMQPAVRSK